MENRFAILWRGVVFGNETGGSIPVGSMRQLKQLAPGTKNHVDVTEFVAWDREENRISKSADPIEWEDEPEGFEEEWEDVKTA